MEIDWILVSVILLSAAGTVGAAGLVARFAPTLAGRHGLSSPGRSVLLFDGETLLDATPDGRRLLQQGPEAFSDRDRASAVLEPLFPGFTQHLSDLEDGGFFALPSRDGARQLMARCARGVARVSVDAETAGDAPRPGADSASLAAMSHELETLRHVAEHSPALAWQQDAQGAVIWANRAYMRQVEDGLPEGATLTWPLPRLFDTDPGATRPEERAPHRVTLNRPGRPARWFDCIAVPHEDRPLFFGLPADATVKAEQSLRDLMQTLTKTFADLPIGLAIFNRARELVLFNPALVELCALETEFLIARPSLGTFLDRLRDRQMMPEPKDYKSWRQRMSALEEQAANGAYQETWTLSSGQTYRVSGRPHPDGAVAFLFEDISAEISLTRRFRAELELSQATLDGLDEAIAVFSPAGVLSLSNAAYAGLWGEDPSISLTEIGIGEATERWQATCAPSAAWHDIRAAVGQVSDRAALTREVALQDGRRLLCRVRPLAGGATLVGFSAQTSSAEAGRTISARAL